MLSKLNMSTFCFLVHNEGAFFQKNQACKRTKEQNGFNFTELMTPNEPRFDTSQEVRTNA